MSETAVHGVHPPVDRSQREGTTRLLHVGRTVRTKGLRDVIRSLAELRDLDIHLDVVGDGNDREACEELAAALDVEGMVTFHGRLPRAEVDAFYERADIFVFPSYREPGGNVSLEAMSFGLPVVVCRRGGPGASVDDSCAIRLDADSPDQLASDCANAVRRLVTDRELRLRMGAAGREHVARHHLWCSPGRATDHPVRRHRRGPRSALAGRRLAERRSHHEVGHERDRARARIDAALQDVLDPVVADEVQLAEGAQRLGMGAPVLDDLACHHGATGRRPGPPPHLLEALTCSPSSQACGIHCRLPSGRGGIDLWRRSSIEGALSELGVELHLESREESGPCLVARRQTAGDVEEAAHRASG